MKTRVLMYDFARGRGYRRDFMRTMLDFMRKLGYNELLLHLEGAYVFDFLPGRFRPDLMTPEDAGDLVEQAKRRGIEVVPATNIYYHTEHFMDREDLQDLRDGQIARGGQKQIDPTHPRVAAFFRAVVDQLARDFRTTRVHIGGDEAVAGPAGFEEMCERYGEYVSGFCHAMVDRGLAPGIWGDVVYKNPGMLEGFPKQTVIYDWYYGGNRKDSLERFVKAGFETIACVSDNGWQAPFNYQSSEFGPERIEAFLEDAREVRAAGGGITVWGLYYGTSFWAALYPIARAALSLTGSLPSDEAELDRKVHQVLFGEKQCPLVKLSRRIYECLYNHDEVTLRDFYTASCHLTFATCVNASLRYLLVDGPQELPASIREAVATTYAETRDLMLEWDDRDRFQRACKVGFGAVLERLRFDGLALDLGSRGRALYHEVSLSQFTDTQAALAKIGEVVGIVREMQACLRSLTGLLEILVRDEGQSVRDPEMVRARLKDLEGFVERLEEGVRSSVPLPSWTGLVRLRFPESDPGYWLPE
ncbi:MAG: family 20 glycosylhydrolase [Candidatus Latescibacteria bacterium]|nr:family 20 glycosylhydrolase [Candidatus Latescibacterota bacterium]